MASSVPDFATIWRPWQRNSVLMEREFPNDNQFQVLKHHNATAAWQFQPPDKQRGLSSVRDFVENGRKIWFSTFITKYRYMSRNLRDDPFKAAPIIVLTLRGCRKLEDDIVDPLLIEIATPQEVLVISSTSIRRHIDSLNSFLNRPDVTILTKWSLHTIEGLKSRGIFLPGVVDMNALHYFNSSIPHRLDELDHIMGNVNTDYERVAVEFGHKWTGNIGSDIVNAANYEATDIFNMWFLEASKSTYSVAVAKASKYMSPLVASEFYNAAIWPMLPNFDSEFSAVRYVQECPIEPSHDTVARARVLWALTNIISARLVIPSRQILSIMEFLNLAKLGLGHTLDREQVALCLREDVRKPGTCNSLYLFNNLSLINPNNAFRCHGCEQAYRQQTILHLAVQAHEINSTT